MIIVKNDKDSEMKIKIPAENSEDLPTEKTLASGEEIELTGRAEAEVLKYMLAGAMVAENDEATANETETAEKVEGETTDETVTENSEAAAEDATNNAEKDQSEEETGSEIKTEVENGETETETKTETETVANEAVLAEKAEIARERAKLAEERAEMEFNKLLAEGRLVPAQKRAYVALAGMNTDVAVAEGQNETVADLLNEFVQSAPKHSLMKEEGENGDGEQEPELTAEEREVAATFGNTEEEVKEIKKENQ